MANGRRPPKHHPLEPKLLSLSLPLAPFTPSLVRLGPALPGGPPEGAHREPGGGGVGGEEGREGGLQRVDGDELVELRVEHPAGGEGTAEHTVVDSEHLGWGRRGVGEGGWGAGDRQQEE